MLFFPFFFFLFSILLTLLISTFVHPCKPRRCCRESSPMRDAVSPSAVSPLSSSAPPIKVHGKGWRANPYTPLVACSPPVQDAVPGELHASNTLANHKMFRVRASRRCSATPATSPLWCPCRSKQARIRRQRLVTGSRRSRTPRKALRLGTRGLQ